MIHNIFTEIINLYKNSTSYQNNPQHRKIIDVDFVDLEDGYTNVIVTSCCHKTIINKVNLFKTIQKFTEKDKLDMIDKSEREVYNKYYTNDFEEFIRQLDYLYSSDKFSTTISKENNKKYFDKLDDYVKDLKRNAYYFLMKEEGYDTIHLCDYPIPDLKNIKILNEHGYYVYADEISTLNKRVWVKACIQKNDDDRILGFPD